jgi:hypothetical protein
MLDGKTDPHTLRSGLWILLDSAFFPVNVENQL